MQRLLIDPKDNIPSFFETELVESENDALYIFLSDIIKNIMLSPLTNIAKQTYESLHLDALLPSYATKAILFTARNFKTPEIYFSLLFFINKKFLYQYDSTPTELSSNLVRKSHWESGFFHKHLHALSLIETVFVQYLTVKIPEVESNINLSELQLRLGVRHLLRLRGLSDLATFRGFFALSEFKKLSAYSLLLSPVLDPTNFRDFVAQTLKALRRRVTFCYILFRKFVSEYLVKLVSNGRTIFQIFNFAVKFLFMCNSLHYSSVFQLLFGIKLLRRNEYNKSSFATSIMTKIFINLLIVTIKSIDRYQNRQTQHREEVWEKSNILPPEVHNKSKNYKIGKCPICLKQIDCPAYDSSGYVYCYNCISSYVKTFKQSYVTKLPSRTVCKIYET